MIYGLFLAFIGYVFTRVLMEDIFSFYAALLRKLPSWLGKPLGLCSVCFTGQLSFWLLLPLIELSYTGILTFAGIISINILIVKLLVENEKY